MPKEVEIKKGIKIRYFIFYLLIAGALFLPHAIGVWRLGRAYAPSKIENEGVEQEEMYAYAPFVNRISQGQNINDPYIFEYRKLSSPFFSELLPSIVMAFTAKILGFSGVTILAKVIFPLLILALWIKIGKLIGWSEGTSFVAGLSLVFAPRLFALFPYLQTWNYIVSPNGLEIERVFHPLLSMLLASMVIILLMKRSLFNKGINLWLLGVGLGSMFYTYVFLWTWMICGIALWLLSMFVLKEWAQIKRLFPSLVIGGLIALPYFMNSYNFSRSSLVHDFVERSVFTTTHLYLLSVVRYVALGFFLFFAKWGVRKPVRRLLVLLLLSGAFLPDVSILLTHVDFEVDHWIGRFIYPLSTFIFVGILGNWLQLQNKRLSRICLGTIGILVLARVLVNSINLSIQPIEQHRVNGKRVELYKWMEDKIPRDSVIGSLSLGEGVNLASYTPYYPFIPNGYRTLASTDEILFRYVFLARKLGVKEGFWEIAMSMPRSAEKETIEKAFRYDLNPFGVLFGVLNHFDSPPYPVHQEIKKKALEVYGGQEDSSLRLDYVLIGPLEKAWVKEKTINCQPIFSNSDYDLYVFKNCF